MESLSLRSTATRNLRTSVFTEIQQRPAWPLSASDRYIIVPRSSTLAASPRLRTNVSSEKMAAQTLSLSQNSYLFRGFQLDLLPLSKIRTRRNVRNNSIAEAPSASYYSSCTAGAENWSTGLLPPNLGAATPRKIPLGRISRAESFSRRMRLCTDGWSKVQSRGKCRAQAASNMGISDNTLHGLSTVPLLEPLSSERAKVAMLLAVAMALCNADRVVMSVAILPLAASHGWSTSFAGIVQSSFLWGYLVSPIPGGMLADRYGGKVVMACGVAVWSLATLLTPWAAGHSMSMLLAMRVLMGLAEGVAMPCMNNIICKWFPRLERARAIGLTMAGFHLGSVSALLLSPGLLRDYGVKGPFWIFGSLGFLWLLLWCPSVFRDPQSNPNITRSEYAHICRGQEQEQAAIKKQSTDNSNLNGSGLPPLGLIFSKVPTWAIIVANSMNNWGYFVLLSWMPIYFSTVLGVNLQQAAWFSAAPWAMMAWAGFVAGACSDYLVKLDMNITTVRKIMQSVGFLGPALALLRLNSVVDPTVASMWLTAALGLSAFSQAGFLVNHQEIAPRYAGFLHGVSNTAGTVAAIISTVGTGFFIERLGSFQAFLTCTSVLYILSAMFWNCSASGERVID